MFGDLARNGLAALLALGLMVFLYPVKPPIDWDGCRAFLNCSWMLPSCAGLLEGNSCFSRVDFGGGALAPASFTARPNIASAMEEYGFRASRVGMVYLYLDRGVLPVRLMVMPLLKVANARRCRV